MPKEKGFAPILIMFLGVIVILGVYFAVTNLPKTQLQPLPKRYSQPTVKPTPSSANDTIEVCGKIPDIIPSNYTQNELIGPRWSKNCQHITWSLYHLGTDCMTCNPTGAPTKANDEGVFIYNAKAKTINNIYYTDLGLAPSFIAWIDENNLSFSATLKAVIKIYNYNLETKQITETTN